jgi:hypothetical protein
MSNQLVRTPGSCVTDGWPPAIAAVDISEYPEHPR